MNLRTGEELYADYLADGGGVVVDADGAQALLEATGQSRTIAGRQACTVPPGVLGLSLLKIRMGGESARLAEVYDQYDGPLSLSALADVVGAAHLPELNLGGPGSA